MRSAFDVGAASGYEWRFRAGLAPVRSRIDPSALYLGAQVTISLHPAGATCACHGLWATLAPALAPGVLPRLSRRERGAETSGPDAPS